MGTGTSGFLESVNRMIDAAIARTDLPPGLGEVIKRVRSVYHVRFPVEIDGAYELIEGWRAAVETILRRNSQDPGTDEAQTDPNAQRPASAGKLSD